MAAVFLGLRVAHAEPPELKGLSPMFWSSSEPNRVEWHVAHVDTATRVWTSFPCAVDPLGLVTNGRAASTVTLPVGAAPGFGWIRLVGRQGISEPHWVAWDSHGAVKRADPVSKKAPPVLLKAPGAIQSHFSERTMDTYRVPVIRGQPIWVEVMAAAFGSMADPFLELRNVHGRRLIFQEDGLGVGADCRIRYLPSDTAELLLAIRDTAYGGGPDYRYVLRIAETPWTGATNAVFSVPLGASFTRPTDEQEPNDEFQKATVWDDGSHSVSGNFGRAGDVDWYRMRLPVGGRYAVRGRTRGVGSGAELRLRWMRSTDAVMAESVLTTGDDAVMEASLEAATDYWIEVRELYGRGGGRQEEGAGQVGAIPDGGPTPGGWRYELEYVPVVGVAAAVDSVTFQVPLGGAFEVPLTLTYPKDFKSTVAFTIQDAGAGWSLEPREAAAGLKDIRLKVRVPEAAPVGAVLSFRVGVGLGGADLSRIVRVSTRSALRKRWPGLVTPPSAVDGWISVGVVETRP